MTPENKKTKLLMTKYNGKILKQITCSLFKNWIWKYDYSVYELKTKHDACKNNQTSV